MLLQLCYIVVWIGAYGGYGAGWGQADGGYGSRKSVFCIFAVKIILVYCLICNLVFDNFTEFPCAML